MFSSVISAIENCGVIAHSNDSLINGGSAAAAATATVCDTMGTACTGRDRPAGGGGGEKKCDAPRRKFGKK